MRASLNAKALGCWDQKETEVDQWVREWMEMEEIIYPYLVSLAAALALRGWGEKWGACMA